MMYKTVNGKQVELTPEESLEFEQQTAEWNSGELARLEAEVRSNRDFILCNEVDPIVSNPFRWASLSEDSQQAVEQYRQALLDVSQQAGFPNDVVWPVKP